MTHFIELRSAYQSEAADPKHRRPLCIMIDDEDRMVQFYLPGSTQRATFTMSETENLCCNLRKLISD